MKCIRLVLMALVLSALTFGVGVSHAVAQDDGTTDADTSGDGLAEPDLADTTEGASDADDGVETEYEMLTRQARQFYADGDYGKAVERLRQAYQVEKNSNILYNVGRIYEEMGDIDNARKSYEEFVAAPNVDLESRKDAVERLKVFKETAAVLKADETEPTPSPAPQPPKPDEGMGALTTTGIVLTVVGGVALGTGAILGVVAQSAHSDFEDAATIADRRDAADTVDAMAPAADGLMIGGGVLAATGIVLWIVGATSDSGSESSASGTAISPIVGADQLGVGFTTRF